MATLRFDDPRRKRPPGILPEMTLPAAQAPPAVPAQAQPQAQLQPQAQPLFQPRAMSQDVMSQLKALQDRITAAPTSPQDIMNDPGFKAQASAIDFSQGQALAGVRRDLASRGMLRGTPAVQAVGAETARFEASKNALVPQMLAQALARRQQDIQNAGTLLNTTAGLENTAFNQGLSEFQTTAPYTRLTKGQASDLAFKEADVTGRYLSPEARSLAEVVLQAKERNAQGQDPGAAAQANDARAQLAALGYDTNLLGSDVTLDQARQNLGRLGVQTAAATAADQALAFNEAAVTGRYLPPAVKAMYNQVVQLKQQNANGQNPAAAQQAELIRGQIAAAGYDPNLVGSDVAVGQARTNVGRAGTETPQARSAALQEQRNLIALDMDRLQAQIAQNPDVGAMAQAQLEMQAKRKQIEQMDAQIKASTAKALSGGGDGGNPFTAWQQYQILRDEKGDGDKTTAATAAKQDKAREKLVDSFRSDYTVSETGADLWTDFMDMATTANGDGTKPSQQKLREDLAGLLENPSVSQSDRAWATAMFWSGQGEKWAQDELNNYRKKPIEAP